MVDWLDDDGAARDDHLEVLRAILRRDYLTRADIDFALKDIAAMAREALGARAALVGVREAKWRAHTAAGEILEEDEIKLRASLAVLEHTRQSEMPLIETGGLALSSESLVEHQVASVLCVPIFRWQSDRTRTFAAALYLDRSRAQPLFTARDVELARDVAEIASRNLNLLWQLDEAREVVDKQRTELVALRAASADAWSFGEWQTRDAHFAEKVIEPLARVAQYDRVQLLITGATGTGKTTLARAFHAHGPRRERPFITLDCAQVTSSETLAAELFGYAKNAGYQNAPPQGRAGKAELADGGTLFIDEVGTLPADLQQRLLALIQEGTFSRLGGSEQRAVDLQIIAATNEDLKARIADGKFREDLYWRLNLMHVELPALDARPADIEPLAKNLLVRAAKRHGRGDVRALTPGAMQRLVAHPWSRAGNVRGLERTIERAVLLAPPKSRELRAGDLELDAMAGGERDATEAVDDEVVRAVVEHRSAKRAAEALGMSYSKLIWHLRREGTGVKEILRRHGQRGVRSR